MIARLAPLTTTAVPPEAPLLACRSCGSEKPETGFYKLGRSQSRDPDCKACRIRQRVERRRRERLPQPLSPVALFLRLPAPSIGPTRRRHA